MLKYAPRRPVAVRRSQWLPAPRRVRRLATMRRPLRAAHQAGARRSGCSKCDAVRKQFGGLVAVNDVELRGPGRRDRRPDRTQRRRQVDHLQPDHRRAAPRPRGEVRFRGERHRRRCASREIARRGISRTFQHVKMMPDMTRARERRAGRAPARPQRRASRDAAPGPRRGAAAVARGRAAARAHRHGRAAARAGGQPGAGPAAPAGDRARAVRRPGAAAARRAGRRPAPPGEAGAGRRAAPAARPRA